jgi:hypothetical protein
MNFKKLLTLFSIFFIALSNRTVGQSLNQAEMTQLCKQSYSVYSDFIGQWAFLTSDDDVTGTIQNIIDKYVLNDQVMVYDPIAESRRIAAVRTIKAFLRDIHLNKLESLEATIGDPQNLKYIVQPNNIIHIYLTQNVSWMIGGRNYSKPYIVEVALKYDPVNIKRKPKIASISSKEAIPSDVTNLNSTNTAKDVKVICQELAENIKSIIKSKQDVRTVYFNNISYKSCGFPTPMSNDIKNYLQYYLKPILLKTDDGSSSSTVQIKGFYSENSTDELEIHLDIIFGSLKEKKSIVSSGIALKDLENSHSKYIPDNYFTTIVPLNNSFNELPIIPSEYLQFEMLTNKGTEALEFYEGEEMQMKIKVNKPCYFRLFSRMSDSLLNFIDERQISSSEVESGWINLQAYRVVAPFQEEVLVGIVSTDPWERLNLFKAGEANFVKIKDLGQEMKKIMQTRAFNRTSSIAYKRINVVTKPSVF